MGDLVRGDLVAIFCYCLASDVPTAHECLRKQLGAIFVWTWAFVRNAELGLLEFFLQFVQRHVATYYSMPVGGKRFQFPPRQTQHAVSPRGAPLHAPCVYELRLAENLER
jgi:hypothetical protein